MSHEGRLLEQPLPELLVKLRRGKVSALLELGSTVAKPKVAIELGDGLIQSVVLHDEVPASLADALKEMKGLQKLNLAGTCVIDW